MKSATTIALNLQTLMKQIPSSIKLIAVGKTFSADAIREAYDLGVRDFGENKVQELMQKSEALQDLSDIRWHFIGHLQSNKVKKLLKVKNLVMIHSVDRIKLVNALNKELAAQNRKLDVLIQVNTSKEESKYGCEPSSVAHFARIVAHSSNLNLKGLMTIGLLGGTPEQTAQCFAALKTLQTQLKQSNLTLQELSMGMTADCAIAIAQGSTMVRVGQAIFGNRNLPDNYYWPK